MEPIQETREPQRLYAPSRSSLRSGGRRSAAGNAAEPWTADHPWRPAGQEPDYSASHRGPLLNRTILLAVILVLNLGLLSHNHLLENVAVVLDLFGAVLLFDLLLRIAQVLRRTRVRWTTFPASLSPEGGGRLEGVVVFRPVLEPIGPVRTVLRCVRDQRAVRPETSGEEVIFEPTVIYQQISEINIAEEKLRQLPLSFALPPDLPGTDLGPDEAVYWQVALRVPVVGPDFETVFLAPVYTRP
jgi:hypothetical protein